MAVIYYLLYCLLSSCHGHDREHMALLSVPQKEHAILKVRVALLKQWTSRTKSQTSRQVQRMILPVLLLPCSREEAVQALCIAEYKQGYQLLGPGKSFDKRSMH